jgi:hypothetical protein
VGVPGIDVEHGVDWALRAWDRLPSEVSGPASLAALIGQERTDAVVHGAGLYPDRLGLPKPSYDPRTTIHEHHGLLTIIDRSKPPPTLDLIVPGLDLAPGKCSAIQGYPNTAKTPFALQLAICVAAGVPFLGHEVRQCPVLYIAFEGGVLSQEREARICAGIGRKRTDVPLTYATAETLSPALLDEVEGVVAARGIGMIVIDTYTSALPPDVQTFNDAAIRAWANQIARLSESKGALTVILLHEHKGGSGTLAGISGHSSLAGALQASIALTRPDADDDTLIEVKCARAAKKGFRPFRIRWTDTQDPNAHTG